SSSSLSRTDMVRFPSRAGQGGTMATLSAQSTPDARGWPDQLSVPGSAWDRERSSLRRPVARLQPVFRQLRLARPRRRLVVVPPPRLRRQRHQDRLDSPTRLQSEHRSAIVHQVELDVPAAPVFLKFLLSLRVRLVLAAADDGRIRLQKGVAGVAHEVERPVQIALQIIEENAADAACLVAVWQVEILVAPALQVVVIDHSGVPIAHPFPRPMEMNDVLARRVERRQIGAAAEPR